MRLRVLASGSKGNSILIEAGDVSVLVDHGLSTRELCRRLELAGTIPEAIDAVIVTHEHSDHVRGLGVMRKRFNTSLFINQATLEAIPYGNIGEGPVHIFTTGESFDIGDIKVYSFSLPHDAADPLGLVFEWKGRRVGIATDLGCATELVRRRLAGADVIVLESNHDSQMLIDGPYPWQVKDRIRRNLGHLSNTQTAQLVGDVAHPYLQALVLAHMSMQNNCPKLAAASAQNALANVSSAKIILAHQDEITESVNLT